MKYREKLINLINKTKSDLDFAKKTYEDDDEYGLVGYLTYLVKELESINVSINEQPNEDFEKEVDKQWNEEYRPYDSGYTIAELSLSDYKETARHFAQWQKEQTINKASQWLNKNVVEYHPRKGELRPIVNINAFREAMEDE